MKSCMRRIGILLLSGFLLTGCGNADTGKDKGLFADRKNNTSEAIPASVETESVEETVDDIKENLEEKNQENVQENIKEDVEEPVEEFLPGYADFDAFTERHLGSVGLVTDKTVLVSIYLNEPDYTWNEEDIAYTRKLMQIGYGFIEDEVAKYGAKAELIFDSEANPDLYYELDIDENIPVYVTTEQEREIDDKVDEWLTNIPTPDLMKKYEADSIGFLFFISHEGCSYSSMHFIDDGKKTWDECCMLYLRDMYSKTLDFETPAVFAHELLHLFGAEDLYKDAKVFEKETYSYANSTYPNEVMINTYETIGGKYVTYPDKVVQEISPLTAYMIGANQDESVVESCPELKKEEIGCFSGSTYDRPF